MTQADDIEREAKSGGKSPILWAILAASFLIYFPSLWVPFHFDDFHHIAENPSIQSLALIPSFFYDPGHFSSRADVGMYRPLLMTSHALTHAIFGLNPVGYHLFNLTLHLLNLALVFSLLKRWLKSEWAAGAAALFWATAAIQLETIAYASARSTLLASFFMLAVIRLTDGDGKIGIRSVCAFAFFILALLSKEIAFVLPILILLRDVSMRDAMGIRLRERWPLYVSTFLFMPAYLGLRVLLFSKVLGDTYTSRWTFLVTQSKVIFWYILETLVPVNLTVFPNVEQAEGLFQFPYYFTAAAAALIFIFAILLALKKSRAGFGISWFFICLLPTSTVVTLILVASVERVYLPLFGLSLAGADVFQRLFQGGKARVPAISVLAVIILLNSAMTVSGLFKWRSRKAVMREMVLHNPEKSLAWSWLGIVDRETGDFEAAKRHTLKAIRISPEDFVARESLCKIYVAMEDYATAFRVCAEVAKDADVPLDSQISTALKLAQVEIKSGRPGSALNQAMRVIELQPDNYEAYMVAGMAHEYLGELAKGKEFYLKALSIFPDFPEAQTQLGILEMKLGNVAESKKILEKIAAQNKPWPEVYSNLGSIAFQEGRMDDSKALFEKSLEIDPDYVYGHFGLGGCLAGKGDLEGASEHFRKAVDNLSSETLYEPEFEVRARLLYARILIDLANMGTSDAVTRQKRLARAREQVDWLKARGAGREIELEWQKSMGSAAP